MSTECGPEETELLLIKKSGRETGLTGLGGQIRDSEVLTNKRLAQFLVPETLQGKETSSP